MIEPVLPLLLAALIAADQEARPSLRAGTLKGPIEIDGRLSEIDWLNAAAIADLTMIEPVAGGPPTGRSDGGFCRGQTDRPGGDFLAPNRFLSGRWHASMIPERMRAPLCRAGV